MSHPVTPIKSTSGFVLVAVTSVIAALLFLAGYFLEQSASETRIAKSENSATKSYYLSEAGANEAIYKLKNDANWKAKFINGTLSNETATRSNVFDNNGSYTISTASVDHGIANITVTATYNSGGQQAKRVIKTQVARATNSASVWPQSIYAGGKGKESNGNIELEHDITINGGVLHANQNFKVKKKNTTITVNDATITASNDVIIDHDANLVLNNSTTSEGAASIDAPQIDFDSSSPNSLKNRATTVYTPKQFTDLPKGTTLAGIIYVTGDVKKDDIDVTVNGILAIGGTLQMKKHKDYNITINANYLTGSGLLAKEDIKFDENEDSAVVINGLLYASRELQIKSTKHDANITVNGGIVGWHVRLSGGDEHSDDGSFNITYNPDLIAPVIDPLYNSEAPIIEVNHWEEQY
ncbi:MAG: hypothetical protein HY974_01160 [Candidatus Kerfeldbacteria bacterium]|nr:hypothetical protein [Candidatus Kerfeldbacteria bacterium]